MSTGLHNVAKASEEMEGKTLTVVCLYHYSILFFSSIHSFLHTPHLRPPPPPDIHTRLSLSVSIFYSRCQRHTRAKSFTKDHRVRGPPTDTLNRTDAKVIVSHSLAALMASTVMARISWHQRHQRSQLCRAISFHAIANVILFN